MLQWTNAIPKVRKDIQESIKKEIIGAIKRGTRWTGMEESGTEFACIPEAVLNDTLGKIYAHDIKMPPKDIFVYTQVLPVQLYLNDICNKAQEITWTTLKLFSREQQCICPRVGSDC